MYLVFGKTWLMDSWSWQCDPYDHRLGVIPPLSGKTLSAILIMMMMTMMMVMVMLMIMMMKQCRRIMNQSYFSFWAQPINSFIKSPPNDDTFPIICNGDILLTESSSLISVDFWQAPADERNINITSLHPPAADTDLQTWDLFLSWTSCCWFKPPQEMQ